MIFNQTKSILLLVLCCFLERSYTSIHYAKPDVLKRISNTDILAHWLSDVIQSAGKNLFKSICLVSPFMAFKDDGDIFFQVISKTHKITNISWVVLRNDSFISNTKLNSDFNLSEISAKLREPDVYIVLIQERNDFATFNSEIETITHNEFFNPRALFILIKVISKCGYYDQCNNLVNYFSELWKYNCMTAIVLIISKCDFQLTVATANAFSPETQCRVPNVLSINCYNFAPEKDNFNITRQEPKTFNGCNFIVAAVPYPPDVLAKQVYNLKSNNIQYEYYGGFHVDLMRLLSERLRFSLTFDQTHAHSLDPFWKRLPNGTEVGIEVDTRNRKIDFFLGIPLSLYQSVNRFDFSPSFTYANLVLFTTDPDIASQWNIVFKVLPPEVWVLINITYFVVYVLYNLLDQIKNSKPICEYKLYRKRISTELLRSGLSLTSTLKPKSSYLRTLYISWCICSLYLTTSYSSTLFELLKNPLLEKRISTIEDLRNSKLTTAVGKDVYKVLKRLPNDRTVTTILKSSFQCTSLKLCLKEFLKHRNFTLVDGFHHFSFFVNLRKAKVHIINQYLLSFGVCVILNKGNPLTQKTQEVVRRTLAAGLVNHWEQETIRKFSNKKDFEIELKEHYIPLEMSDLNSAFILLLFGYVVSLAVFIIEYFMNLFKHKISF